MRIRAAHTRSLSRLRPLDWKDEGVIDADGTYRLCRRGQSKVKPFCDGTHTIVEFNGDEAAATETVAARATTRLSPKINIQDEHSICVHSGFCGTRLTNVWEMRKKVKILRYWLKS